MDTAVASPDGRERRDFRLAPAAAGAWIACGFGVAWPAPVSLRISAGSLVVLVLAVAVSAFGRRSPGPWRAQAMAVSAVLAAALAVTGAEVAARACAVAPGLEARGEVEAVLRVVGRPQQVVAPGADGEPRLRVLAVAERLPGSAGPTRTSAPVLVLGPSSWSDLTPGQRVAASGRLRPVEPGDDVAALLIAHGAPSLIADAPIAQAAAARLRAGLLDATAHLPEHASALLPGIAVGDTSRLGPVMAEQVRHAALTHLVAVSGAHVSLVLAVVMALTLALARPVRIVVCAATLGGLVLLVGPEPSVLRAAAMGLVVLLAFALGRPAGALPALAAAVIALLLADPWASRSYGFALSVSATAGLVVLSGPWAARLSAVLPAPLAVALAVPAAAQIACAPILILLDPAVPVHGVLANAAVAPVVPIITILSLLATLLLPWLPQTAACLLFVAQGGTWWITQVAATVTSWPVALLPWWEGWPGALALAAVEAAILVLAIRAAWRRAAVRVLGPLLGLASALVLALAAHSGSRGWLVGALPQAWPPADWVIVQCDVGQGSALLARSGPQGATVMVDVGRDDGLAARCLHSAGVRRLDLLVLTHADADHTGGLTDVLASLEVGQALISGFDDGERDDRVLAALGAHQVPTRRAWVESEAGSGVLGSGSGAIEWSVVWPTARSLELAAPQDGNDQSLSVLLEVAGIVALVHGDIGAPAQSRLLASLAESGAQPRAIDIATMPHHGSPDQHPDLARVLAPTVALVSVGRDNDYGHPAESVVRSYQDQGVMVARTDECGPIAVSVRSGRLWVFGCD